ncbi:MAG: hypothetical protein JSW62_02285 [Thermoplasmatales archaeon]|nr:MAG: hypothetical protein JSW62_02285 [Thermoplasmatales archaeon]
MKIRVKLSKTSDTKEINLEKGSKVEDLLKKIKLKPDALIVMDRGKPIPIDDILDEDQELTILKVSSGG